MQSKPKPDLADWQGCPVDDLDEDEGYSYFIPSSGRSESGLKQARVAAFRRVRSPSTPPPAFLAVGYK